MGLVNARVGLEVGAGAEGKGEQKVEVSGAKGKPEPQVLRPAGHE